MYRNTHAIMYYNTLRDLFNMFSIMTSEGNYVNCLMAMTPTHVRNVAEKLCMFTLNLNAQIA